MGDRFETAYLQNTIVNICADIDYRYIEYTGVIKSIISGESIRGEYKNGASFDFKPLTRLIFSANKMPKSKDKSYAWYRRFQIIKFPNKFSDNSEPGFEKKLNNEIPGIFNWALEGLKRLESQGHFTIAEEMKSNIYDYKNNHNDTVAAFLNENTTKYEGSFTVVGDLYAEYVQYCEALCLEVESLLSFGKRMAQLGFPSSPRRVNGKSQRCYLDIKKVS
ncbi:MAG: DNA primase family protein [Halanaerobiales bacterium]